MSAISKDVDNSPPDWLLNKTFAIEYSPNCKRKWLLRLVGYRRGVIDHLRRHESLDAIGFGDTLEEAAFAAKIAFEKQKTYYD